MASNNPFTAELERRRQAGTLASAGAPQRQSPRGEYAFFRDLADSVGTEFTRGVARTLDLPNDLVGGLLSAAGVDDKTLTTFGFDTGAGDYLEKGLHAAGLQASPDYQVPMPVVGRIAGGAGSAAVPLGLLGTGARVAGQGPKLIAPLLRQFRSAPAVTSAVELSSGAGSGAGGALAHAVAPDNPYVEMLFETVGGVFAPGNIPARTLPSLAKGASRQVDPFLPGGSNRQAARKLQAVVHNPEAAARNIEARTGLLPNAALTPAQESQDAGLLRLEHTLTKSNASSVGAHLEGAEVQTNAALHEAKAELEGSVPGAATREYFDKRLTQADEALTARVERSRARARERIDAAAATVDRAEASRIFSEELEGALVEMKAAEKRLWERVDDEVPAPTEPFVRAYEKARAGQRELSDPANIPELAREIEGKLPETIPLGEMQELRSRLLQQMREERAKEVPNRRKLRVLGTLQEAALESMEGAVGGEPLADAIAFSRTLNERFRQGVIGQMRGKARTGGERVAPERRLEKLIPPSSQAPINVAQAERAFEHSAQRGERSRAAMADFIRTRFAKQAIDDSGQVNPKAASKFLADNRELLERFPEVRDELGRADTAQRAAERIARTGEARRGNIHDKRSSRAALYLDAPVDKEIARVLASRDPGASMAGLVRMAKRDPEGLALKGLKGQFMREMFDRAAMAATDMADREKLSGRKLREFFDGNRATIDALFAPDEIERLERIVNTAVRAGKSSGVDVSEMIASDSDALTDLVSRIAGAKLGAHAAQGTSGATLVAAGAGSRLMQRLTKVLPGRRVRDVLAAAVVDRDVMLDLLRRMELPRGKEELRRYLNAFLVNPAITQVEAGGQKEKKEPQGAMKPLGKGTRESPYIGNTQAKVDWFREHAPPGALLKANDGRLYRAQGGDEHGR